MITYNGKLFHNLNGIFIEVNRPPAIFFTKEILDDDIDIFYKPEKKSKQDMMRGNI